MILIGQYDSPFVRRVGIAMTLYGLAFEHKPWSTFGEADKIRAHNPLTRVPTLVLDNGDALLDSHSIIDYLDGLAGPERALFPAGQPARYKAMRVAALATGVSDKGVSLFYEQKLHSAVSPVWEQRCRAQIIDGLRVLETERAAVSSDWWFGAMGHADIAVAAMLRHMGEAHPGMTSGFPALAAHAARCEALPVFQQISQVFIPPS